jgi:HTH-type transcriptional regulator / antitoxin HipB
MVFKRKLTKRRNQKLRKHKELKNNISMKSNKLKSFRIHLDEEYGLVGTKSRTAYEEGFEAFKLGVLLQDLRTKEGMTQEELANKCGTTKSYISRIENNASDIRLSTIMRFFREGFGKQIKLLVN